MTTFVSKPLLLGLASALLLLGCHSPSGSSASTSSAPTSSAPNSSAPQAETDSAEFPSIAIIEEALETQPIPAQDDIAERLKIAGIDSPQAAKDFLDSMQTAAAKEDKAAIANLVRYPFTTYKAGEVQREYSDPSELIADFDNVVTAGVLAEIQNASYEDIFVNYQGAMIGNGAVWFMNYDEGIRIKAINPI